MFSSEIWCNLLVFWVVTVCNRLKFCGLSCTTFSYYWKLRPIELNQFVSTENLCVKLTCDNLSRVQFLVFKNENTIFLAQHGSWSVFSCFQIVLSLSFIVFWCDCNVKIVSEFEYWLLMNLGILNEWGNLSFNDNDRFKLITVFYFAKMVFSQSVFGSKCHQQNWWFFYYLALLWRFYKFFHLFTNA